MLKLCSWGHHDREDILFHHDDTADADARADGEFASRVALDDRFRAARRLGEEAIARSIRGAHRNESPLARLASILGRQVWGLIG